MATVSSVTKAALVYGPTTPSITNPCDFWNSTTAASVLWPKMPSTTKA